MTRHRATLPPAALALALAAAFGGAGCLLEATPDLGGADIYWTFRSRLAGDLGDFTDASSTVCGLAGVDEIEITFTTPAGQTLAPSSGWCVTSNGVPGAAFRDMDAGTWEAWIVGLRGGDPVFAVSRTFTVFDGEDARVTARLEPLYYDARVDYTVADLASCSRLELRLREGGVVGDYYSTDPGTANPGLDLPCVASGAKVLPSLPPGVYELDPIVALDAGGSPSAYSDCNPTWTQAAGADKTFSVAVAAAAPGSACAK